MFTKLLFLLALVSAAAYDPDKKLVTYMMSPVFNDPNKVSTDFEINKN